MNPDVQRERQTFISYEYKELNVKEEQAAFYLDCYENFGWKQDENFPLQNRGDSVILKLKRNRKIVNKVELTRLQRHFEADMQDIFSLENSKTSLATILATVEIKLSEFRNHLSVYYVLFCTLWVYTQNTPEKLFQNNSQNGNHSFH